MTAGRSGSIEGAGGTRLHYRHQPVDDPAGRILAVHGLGEHSGRLDRLAECASGLRMDYQALDLRGHGRSDGRRGHARTIDLLLEDLDRFRRSADAGRPSLPTVWLGHSLGALLVGRYVQEFGFPGLAGAVLVAPFVRVALQPPAWKVRLGAVADRILPTLTLDNEIRADMLFRTPDEARAWREDPLVHQRISARLWGEMQRHAAVLVRRASQSRTPMLIQIAGDDRVVSVEAGRDFVSRLGGKVRVREYDGAFHDLYHDPASDEALADLAEWLRGVVVDGGSAKARGAV